MQHIQYFSKFVINKQHKNTKAVDRSCKNYNIHNAYTLEYIIKKKSYVAINSCVLEHILTCHDLSNHEKLFYILADSLALINKNSNANHRAIALPSEDWAKRLSCSRALIFKMQKSLQQKGYFIINKDWDKLGRNKRNIITPTLPDIPFNALCNSNNRAGQAHLPYNDLTECKRTFLDRTKLFIKLNYDLLLTLTTNSCLTQKQKIIWLDFYIIYYKISIIRKQAAFDIYSDSNDNDSNHIVPSFITSYQELATKYACDNKQISKAIRNLEVLGFIKTENFYTRKKNNQSHYFDDNSSLNNSDSEHSYDDLGERQDKSLWKITLSLPGDYRQQLENIKNRANSVHASNSVVPNVTYSFKIDYAKSNSAPHKSSLYSVNTKVAVIPATSINQNKDKVTILEEINSATSVLPTENLSANSLSLESPLNQAANRDIKHGALYDPHVAKSRLLLSKSFKLNINLNRSANFCTFPNLFVYLGYSPKYKSSFNYFSFFDIPLCSFIFNYAQFSQDNNFLTINQFQFSVIDKSNIQEQYNHYISPANKYQAKQSSKPSKYPFKRKSLLDFHPLSNDDVLTLQTSSSREFNYNAMNEILLSIAKKMPNHSFPNKKAFMTYMTKLLQAELRQATKINNEAFKIRANNTQEDLVEKYLTNIENDFKDNSKDAHLRRKLAATLPPLTAYELLRNLRKITCTDKKNTVTFTLNRKADLNSLEGAIVLEQVRAIYSDSIENIIYQCSKYRKKPVNPQTNKKMNNINPSSPNLYNPADFKRIWGKTRLKLIEYYDKHHNNTGDTMDKVWFSRLEEVIKDTNSSAIILKAASNFVRDWVSNNCKHIIEKIMAPISPEPFYVKIIS